jgi:histidinol-phosphate aminotransferase
VLFNGSSNALDTIFTFLFSDKNTILLPVPNFTFYINFEKYKRLRFVKIPYKEDWSIEKITGKLKSGIQGIYISNPNNPIGYLFSSKELEQLISRAAKNNTLAIIDEAYFEFSGVTVKDLTDSYPNLIVVRILSKAFGLAGLRIGYTITNRQMANILEELVRKPMTIGLAGLRKVSSFREIDFRNITRYVRQINRTKRNFMDFLKKRGIKYYPSSANFLTIRLKNAKVTINRLKKEKILALDLNNYPDSGTTLKNCIRIAIPSTSDLPRLKNALNLIKFLPSSPKKQSTASRRA